MAKENCLLFLILLLTVIFPGNSLGNAAIKTTQHIVVIDPGHGGTDTGLVSPSGLQEKDIVLQLAKQTAQKLETRYNVFLTRTMDENIPLRERVFIANKNSADLFVSIHLHTSNQGSGYFFYFAPPDSTLPTAQADSWKSQPLIHQPESKQAADSFSNMFSFHKKSDQFSFNPAPVIFLEGATMPAILIEPLSISTLPQTGEAIQTLLDEYSLLILKSIDLYFEKVKPPLS